MRRIERKSFLLALSITVILTGLLLYAYHIRSLNIGPTQKVVIALNNINARTVITDKQVKEISVPQKFVVMGSISDKDQVVGKIPSENIYAGEQIILENLKQDVKKNGLSVVLPEGYRAITIKVDPVSGVGGHIQNKDFVDILVYLTPPFSEKEVIKTIFQNVEVLDTGSNNKEFLTLCMTPEDVEKLFLIEEIGKTRLVLRPISDKNETELPGTDIDFIP